MGRAIQILRMIGVLLCALSLVLALTNAAQPHLPQPPVALNVLLPWSLGNVVNLWIGLASPAAIAVMFWRATALRELEQPSRKAIVLLGLQTVLAFLVAEELQFVVAVEAGLLLAPRTGAVWVALQASAAWLISSLRPELMAWAIPQQSLWTIAVFMLVALLYNFLAFSLGLLAAMEGRQRRTLERVNGELREAQQGVVEAARLGERLHLARELHDAIGHQMSALSINLQLAARLSQDQARRPVLEAYQLAGLLLADIRAVVSATRAPEIRDLAEALREIAERVHEPAIVLDLAAALEGEIGHAFFRCAQEIITNAVRHSGARHIWIQTRLTGGEYILTAWDDGRGNPELAMGNGLHGMEERMREHGGSAEFVNRSGAGFQVRLRAGARAKESAA